MPDRDTSTSLLKSGSLIARALQGAGFAELALVLFFAFGSVSTDGYQRMILPLVTVPIAGAMGGTVFYATDSLRRQGGARKLVANVVSVLVYAILVTLAFILGGS